MEIITKPIAAIRPYEKNPRHTSNATRAVAESIRRFGFKQPIVVDEQGVVVCGHVRLAAAKSLGMTELPCVLANDLTPDEIRAFRLLDNKLHEKSSWDVDALNAELADLDFDFAPFDVDFNLNADVDFKFDDESASKNESQEERADQLDSSYQIVVTCDDEDEQAALYERLIQEGYRAKLCNL